jgi:hypothetical protein
MWFRVNLAPVYSLSVHGCSPAFFLNKVNNQASAE